MKTNVAVKRPPVLTHEAGPAEPHQKPIQELERAVASCLLGEDTFYEDGGSVKDRITALATSCNPILVSDLAIKARNKWRLRHAPLQLVLGLLQQNNKPKMNTKTIFDVPPGLISHTISQVIQRPDEMAELLAMYWANRNPTEPKKIPAQLKKGLAAAFPKFDAYQLAKWNRDGAIKLRDVLFLCHAKPQTPEQAELWKQLINKTLPTPDTWEVALSSGADKKESWERLINTNKLPYMALLQNLRGMMEVGVGQNVVGEYLLKGAEKSKALPFRYLSALRACPQLAEHIEKAMLKSLNGSLIKIPGMTYIVVDVSGSMDAPLSDKSTVSRLDAACSLAVMAREVCESVRVFTFSERLKEVANYRGLALVNEIHASQNHGGTYLGRALEVLKKNSTLSPARVVIVTDEQSADGGVQSEFMPGTLGYVLNVAVYKPALKTGKGWTRINGLSEQFMSWVVENEGLDKGNKE